MQKELLEHEDRYIVRPICPCVPGYNSCLSKYLGLRLSASFRFVIHLSQELDVVLIKSLVGESSLGGISELLYEPLLAPFTRLRVRVMLR